MSIPLVLLRFVGKAALNYVGFGIAGDFTIDVLPGIAKEVWKCWSPGIDESRRRAELQALAQGLPPRSPRKSRRLCKNSPATNRRMFATAWPAISTCFRRVHQSLPARRFPWCYSPVEYALAAGGRFAGVLLRPPPFTAGNRPLPGVDWELVELLGVGGFGEVWKARNPRFDSIPPVALKFCLDPAARDRLLTHEGAVLNQVMHEGAKISGVVRLLHTYLHADPPCLAYELVAGGDLAGLMYKLQKGKDGLTAAQAGAILYRLARTMGQVHHLHPPIVHRDLKPANILVQPLDGGNVHFRIADFGIGGVASSQAIEQARKRVPANSWGRPCSGSHTPLYASPEQMDGRPPDPR